jgi:hypothetical protein
MLFYSSLAEFISICNIPAIYQLNLTSRDIEATLIYLMICHDYVIKYTANAMRRKWQLLNFSYFVAARFSFTSSKSHLLRMHLHDLTANNSHANN